jgi:hypothetical protein
MFDNKLLNTEAEMNDKSMENNVQRGLWVHTVWFHAVHGRNVSDSWKGSEFNSGQNACPKLQWTSREKQREEWKCTAK